MYHQVLVLPNRGQPTSSQYVLALVRLASAWFAAGPLMGHPVSVTQTSLPLAAAWVAPKASLKRDAPFEMEFAIVVFKMLALDIEIHNYSSKNVPGSRGRHRRRGSRLLKSRHRWMSSPKPSRYRRDRQVHQREGCQRWHP